LRGQGEECGTKWRQWLPIYFKIQPHNHNLKLKLKLPHLRVVLTFAIIRKQTNAKNA